MFLQGKESQHERAPEPQNQRRITELLELQKRGLLPGACRTINERVIRHPLVDAGNSIKNQRAQ